jgi:hypothetical protein
MNVCSRKPGLKSGVIQTDLIVCSFVIYKKNKLQHETKPALYFDHGDPGGLFH